MPRVACTQNADPAPSPPNPQTPANQLITEQAPPKIDQRILDAAHPSNTSIVVNLSEQRAYLLVNDRNAVDSPCSTGKYEGLTPTGTFKITEKHKEAIAPFFGDFIDRKTQQVVRSGANVKISVAPSGTVFRRAPGKWILRLSTPTPVVIAAGNLPGYPSTGGSIVLPENIAKIFFERTDVETPVVIYE